MPDYSIRAILAISLGLIIIVNLFGVIGIGGYVYKKTIEISRTLSESNEVLEQMKVTLATLNDLPQQLNTINQALQKVIDSLNSTNIKLEEIDEIRDEIEDTKILTSNVSLTLKNLSYKYPPSQNLYLYFNNTSEFQINSTINNAIEQRFTRIEEKVNNFYWTLFGSLFGITIIGFAITLFKHTSRKK